VQENDNNKIKGFFPCFFSMYTTLQFNSQPILLWTLCFDSHHFANERGQRNPTAANSNEREYTLSLSPFYFF